MSRHCRTLAHGEHRAIQRLRPAPRAPARACRPDLRTPQALMHEYHHECSVVQQALQGELNKVRPAHAAGADTSAGLVSLRPSHSGCQAHRPCLDAG